ncbi:hypothetical protein BC833DRAFT_610388 [Globomyces pollinis-pini]|nr:hypothetical protein BC833DRAFT_610388 [Globomyces pollinis-pini]
MIQDYLKSDDFYLHYTFTMVTVIFSFYSWIVYCERFQSQFSMINHSSDTNLKSDFNTFVEDIDVLDQTSDLKIQSVDEIDDTSDEKSSVIYSESISRSISPDLNKFNLTPDRLLTEFLASHSDNNHSSVTTTDTLVEDFMDVMETILLDDDLDHSEANLLNTDDEFKKHIQPDSEPDLFNMNERLEDIYTSHTPPTIPNALIVKTSLSLFSFVNSYLLLHYTLNLVFLPISFTFGIMMMVVKFNLFILRWTIYYPIQLSFLPILLLFGYISEMGKESKETKAGVDLTMIDIPHQDPASKLEPLVQNIQPDIGFDVNNVSNPVAELENDLKRQNLNEVNLEKILDNVDVCWERAVDASAIHIRSFMQGDVTAGKR